jgi:hypothetical protein
MRSLALCVLVVIVAPGRARADDCARACDHMRVVSEKELSGMGELSPEEKKKLREKSQAGEPARLAKCVAACKEGRVDTRCVLAATDTIGYLKCLKAKPPGGAASSLPPDERERVLDQARASASFRGRPLPAREQAKILDALAHLPADRRTTLIGAWLGESGATMYGEDVARAGEEITRSGDERLGFAILGRHLAPAIAQMGCARSVGDAVALAPAEQAAHLAESCPPPPAARLFPAARVKGTPLGPLMLALILEQRARQSGFAGDPLHRRFVEILLSR